MTLEARIEALLEQAAPLRLLPDAEAEAKGLPKIVEQINELRALIASGRAVLDEAIAAQHEAEFQAVAESVNPPKRGPGRPKKAS